MRRRTLWVNLAIGAAIVVVIAVILAALRPSDAPVEQRTVTVARGDITATVTASGTVERAGVVELAFASAGTISEVNVEPGQTVSVNEVLAEVDDTAALQQLAAAESTLAQAVQSAASTDASVANASAVLADARRVAKETNRRNRLAVDQARESLRVAQDLWDASCLDPDNAMCPNPAAQTRLRAAQASIDSAQLSVDIAQQNVIDNAASYNAAVDQANELLLQRQRQESSACESDSSSSVCTSAQTATITARQAYDNAVRTRTTGLVADQEAFQTASLNLASANVALQQAQAELRKAGDDSERSARQALETAERTLAQGKASGEQAISNAQGALNSALAAQRTVEVADGAEVTAAEAGIEAAQVGVEVAQRAVDDTRLVTPVAGTVGSVPYVVGELAVATGSQGGITVLPEGPLEVVADFAESDAANIYVGAPATVTFDALAGEQAEGTVVAVDPVATTSATGLITFGVRVQVNDAPAAAREGMTASVSVLVDEASGALVVPQGAITGSGERATVLLQGPEGTTESVPVTIGLQGDAGTEITAGVSEGDVLVIPSADDLSFPDGGVPGSGRDDDPDGPFGGGGED
jgi:RND family efflux transporter MFP subunit